MQKLTSSLSVAPSLQWFAVSHSVPLYVYAYLTYAVWFGSVPSLVLYFRNSYKGVFTSTSWLLGL